MCITSITANPSNPSQSVLLSSQYIQKSLKFLNSNFFFKKGNFIFKALSLPMVSYASLLFSCRRTFVEMFKYTSHKGALPT